MWTSRTFKSPRDWMSDGCSKLHLEKVRLVRFRTDSDKFLYMIGKRMRYLIDVYGSWRLNIYAVYIILRFTRIARVWIQSKDATLVMENSTCVWLIFVLFCSSYCINSVVPFLSIRQSVWLWFLNNNNILRPSQHIMVTEGWPLPRYQIFWRNLVGEIIIISPTIICTCTSSD